ncbi:MAG: tetratricopeptide repeat protein [Deltaproteobacteria bacterium]|nr:tetratricopeptide repeat protein [Deltaproteobacteria bacterium]
MKKQPKKQLTDLKNKLFESIRSGNEQTKIDLIAKQLIENYPHDPYAFQELAFVAFKKHKKYAEAAQIAEQGLKYNPTNIRLKKLLAESLSHLTGEENRADKLFKELVSEYNGKEKRKLASTYADFSVRRGDIKQAQDIYKMLLKEKPNDALARVDLAKSYRIDHDYEECLKCLTSYPLPENIHWLIEKTHCHIDLGQIDEAESLINEIKKIISSLSPFTKAKTIKKIIPFEKAIDAEKGDWKKTISWLIKEKYNKGTSSIYNAIINRLIKNDEIDEGLTFLLNSLSNNKDSISIIYMIDRIMQKGNVTKEKTQEIVKKCLEIAPNNWMALMIAAQANQESSPEQALALWNEAWQLVTEKSVDTLNKKIIKNAAIDNATFLRKLEKYQEALLILDQVKTNQDINTWAIDLERAINLVRLGSYSEAYDILLNVNKIQPNNHVVLDQLGVCLRLIGRHEEAIKIYEHKVSLFENDRSGWQGLGITQYQLGQHDEALKSFERILKIDPTDIDAKLLIAEIYVYKKELDKAKEFLSGIDPAFVLQKGSKIDIESKLANIERHQIEQLAEIEEAKKLSYLGVMATATAHELNQPIGIIRATTDAALNDFNDGYLETNDIKPILQRIFNQTERLAAIIENFRRFARGDRTHREKVDLNKLVEKTIEGFEEQFKHRNIKLRINLHDKKPLPVAWANYFQLEEVLINLLTNARDAVEGKKDAYVFINVGRMQNGSPVFSVSDNGPGLPEEYRKNMFVPFVSTKSTEKGTGLGLFISRRIVNSLGGQLRYIDNVKGGARFIVTLPPLKG